MFAKKITKSASARDLRRILWHDIARVRYFLRLALLVLAGVMSAPAHANIACEIANISLTASAGTISVPVAAPVVCLLAVLVWAKHHANIRRLLSGTEPKIGKSSTSAA